MQDDTTITPWKRFLNLLELDKKDIQQLFYYAIFAGLVALSLPLGIQAIINLIQGAQVSTSWIILVVLVTIGVGFQGVLQVMQLRILENIQQKIFTRASFEFAYRFPKIRMEALRDYYPPELANRFFDILTVQKGLSKILIDFPSAFLQIFFGLILLSFYHPFFIAFGFLLVILIYIVFQFTAKKGLSTSLLESKSKYKVAHWLQEIARSLITFKLSGGTQLAMKRNDELTTSYLKARESHFRILLSQFVQMIGFKILVTAGLLSIGGLLVLNQQMNIGQFVAAEIIILLVITSVEKLIKGLESFYDVLTSLEKLGQVVDKELEPQTGINPFETSEELHLELDQLSYKSPDNDTILDGINLVINNQDTILLTGPASNGKTTLLRILSGLLVPTTGSFYVNNTSIQGIWLNKYRIHVGQILPSQTPFEGTILENVTLGHEDISQQDLFDTMKSMGLLDFVKKQPNGIHTKLYPEGQQIPYTVAKRILLVRAILSKPKLLIFKDPLEHFDPDESKRIIDFLTHPDRNWALIVVSQNSYWQQKCSRTIRLENGKIQTINTL